MKHSQLTCSEHTALRCQQDTWAWQHRINTSLRKCGHEEEGRGSEPDKGSVLM